MKPLFACLLVLAAAHASRAHFVYLVPSPDGKQVQVVFSDTLEPDEKVKIDKIASTNLYAVDARGKTSTLKWEKSSHALVTKAPAGTALVTGVTEYGVAQSKHTKDIPVLIRYHSAALLTHPAKAPKPLVPLRIVPKIENGKLRFTAVYKGQPLADSSCSVLAPGEGKGLRGTTTSTGAVPGEFEKAGRYAVWVRVVDDKPGEVQGKKYRTSHTYATLVVDFAP